MNYPQMTQMDAEKKESFGSPRRPSLPKRPTRFWLQDFLRKSASSAEPISNRDSRS